MAVDDLIREAAPAGPLPPHNTDAEESVLGAALIDREAIGRVAPFLRPEDFYRERNGTIYAAMIALYDRRDPVDYMTLSDELGRGGQLEAVGGIVYLGRLLEVVPTSLHIEEYGHIVERTALMRRLISAGGKIAGLGYADAYDIDTTLEKAEQLLFGVSHKRVARDFESLSDVLRAYLEQLEQLQEGERLRYGVPTGFIDLDKLTGGLQRSDLVILAARPSMGKTSLALNIAANAALRYRATVGMFSLEMSKAQLAARLLSTESGVDSTRLRLGRLNETESHKLFRALDVLSDAPIYVDDSPGLSIMDLRLKARRLHADVDDGLHLIIVDYLQLIEGSRGRENRVQEISEISRALKSLSRELHVPVLALSQLSRAVETRTPHIPMLSDLRESGSIEQDADVVMFIYREDLYNKDTEKKGIAEIHLAKHRNGPVGQVSLLFNERQTKFVDLEPFRE
jgi:replicative DNA helicase